MLSSFYFLLCCDETEVRVTLYSKVSLVNKHKLTMKNTSTAYINVLLKE